MGYIINIIIKGYKLCFWVACNIIIYILLLIPLFIIIIIIFAIFAIIYY